MRSCPRRPSLALAVASALAVVAQTARPVASQERPAAKGPASSSPAIGKKVAVLELDPLGMDPDKVARLEALFRMELERLAGVASPSPREIARTLRSSPLRACDGESSCLAAIGKKLMVDFVVTGNVAALGDSYVVHIKVVDSATGQELRRIASDPLRGNPDELIDAVRVAAYRLLAPERLLGAISILADVPGAEVRLDDRVVGKTPLARPIEGLALGHHKLAVTARGFSRFTDEVLVRFQKTTRVVVTLSADPSQPHIDLARRAPPGPERRWYQKTWFLVGAGIAAVVVGGAIGHALAQEDIVDCSASAEACR